MKHKRFGEYLKVIRKQSDVSQKEVADKLGYSTSQFVSNWERGVSLPPVKILKALGRIYKMEPNLILKEYLEEIFRWERVKVTARFQRSK